jgi:hypothetical protein
LDLVVYALGLTYILKVLMVIGGVFLIFFAVSLSVYGIGDWTLVIAFILLVMGIALSWYGKELKA